MSACNFENLVQFVDDQLDSDKQLELYDHLDRCDICRDAVCQVSRDLNRALFIYCSHCAKHGDSRRLRETVRPGRALANANALARPAMRRSSGCP